ncbi:MAG: LysE family transporter [Spirochaetales bacterium]|nr:LysE family transporter [Spirochaetales bacterium]
MLYLQGIFIGLLSGFPAGPLGAIVIKDMLHGHINPGFFKGLGAVGANLLYAIVIIFGVGFISDFLLEKLFFLRITGSVIIIIMGLGILLRKNKEQTKDLPQVLSLGTSVLTGFMIAVSNPTKLAVYTGFITFLRLDLLFEGISPGAWALAAGIGTGSLIWWLLFVVIAIRLKHKNFTGSMKKINLLFGSCIILLGVIILSVTLAGK